MPERPVSVVARQVAKARRRLFVQRLLDYEVWCWASALALCALWFLAQPWLLGNETEVWLRWAIAGGIFAMATALGLARAWQTAPSLVSAALEVDQRFRLKERVTSCLTLRPELQQTPAGVALAADADVHASQVNVAQGFPLCLSRKAALVPALAGMLTLVAIFYNPVFDTPEVVQARPRDEIKVAQAKLIEEKFNNVKKPTTFQWPADQPKDEKLKEIENLRADLFKQPFDANDKDKVQDRLQQLLPLEDKIKDRMDDLKAQQQRNKEMQKQLQQMGKDGDKKLANEGPGQGVDDALNKGDLGKVQDEMRALADKLKDKGLDDEERQKLENQLAEVKEKLDNLADQKDLKDKLEKALKNGDINEKEFQAKMAEAKDQAIKLKDLKDLGDKIGEAKDALDKGEQKEAAAKLGQAAEQLKKLDPMDQEMRQLQQEQQRLAELRDAMNDGLGNRPDQPPGGRRPFAQGGKMDSKDALQHGQSDPNAPARVVGAQKGGSFNKIPAGQVNGVFRQAQMDAPQAIERQRVPAEAAPFVGGYYENLSGGQKK